MRVKLHWLPDRKFLAGGVAGLVTWLLTLAASTAGVEIPAELMTSAVGLVMGAVYYLVPPSAADIVRRIDGDLKRRFALEEIASADSRINAPLYRVSRAAGSVAQVAFACLMLGGLALTGPLGCASYEASKAEELSPAARIFALQADYNAAAYAAVAYLESGHATPAAKRAIGRLDQVAFAAVTSAADAARSGDSVAIAVSTAAAQAALAELVGYVEARRRDGPGGPPAPPTAAGTGAGT